jgi:lysophospholipase L1-like esterase
MGLSSMKICRLNLGLAMLVLLMGTGVPVLADEFAFRDGDRVLLLGNTVMERAQESEWLEAGLVLAAPGTDFIVRNLGWSGDTVFGEARSYFGPPAEGFDRLRKQVSEFKPTVVFVCYGAVAAWDGEAGMEAFLAGYRELLKMLRAESAVREIIVLSPPPAENPGAPLPDMTAYNENLGLYAAAIGVMTGELDSRFADWFGGMQSVLDESDAKLTDNGIHFNDGGYRQLAKVAVTSLGLPWRVDEADAAVVAGLREKIKRKNRLYFHRWRPTNETYLFGFRAHEQGQNAKEIPMYDPLVAKADAEINELKRALDNHED